MWEIENKPTDACANDEVVVKFIQHPSYLAKTYYPRKLFKKFGMKDIGSKSVKISPDSWATRKHPDIAVTSCIYVSGKKTDYQKMLKDVEENNLDQTTLDFIRTIERVDIFTSEEKIKNLDPTRQINKLEVVIHASQEEESILEAFLKYVDKLGGNAEKNKSKFVGGLTFLPVTIEHGLEEELAEFSHLRALRSIPKLRFNKPNLTRTLLKETFAFPQNYQLSDKFKVCIFDGGLGSTHLLGDLAKEIIPADVSASHPHFLAHGSEVCSTYLFGPYQPGSGLLGSPYTSVDVVRVLSPEDEHDPDLFNVLTRIEAVLKEKKYKYINLSLGPQIAVDDDDVHVWTSVLDQYLQDGHCLATIAIGNDGDLPGELGRIQPPSDMVNSLAIGAIDCQSKDWERAPYSCTGPGRSPGLIKPDGVLFGGSEKEMFHVYSPLTHSIIATMGTSFASPLAMRVAAGIDALTDFELTTNSIKALMIHKAKPEKHSQNNVGWGKLPHQPEEVLECLDDEATILFQGELKPDQHLRIPIPVPKDADCTWVVLKATFCTDESPNDFGKNH
ncbi:peptidase, S8/S53 family [Acinetobacter baumannii OIFC074]|nr:peptidase, S8/S53 family [Acinetobacter baumannii OIFC074]